MDTRFFLRTLVAAAALSAAAPGFAQQQPATSGSAALLGYTLTDLAPDDGIAPSISFTHRTLGGGSSVQGRDADNAPYILDAASFDADGNAVATQPGARSAASVQGRTVATSIDMDASLSAVARAAFTDEFVLSPNTRLTLTFGVDVAAIGTGLNPDGTVYSASTYASASAHLAGNSGTQPVYIGWIWNTNFPAQQPPATMTADLFTGAAGGTGYVGLESYSQASVAPMTPVPEPGAWAMLAAGLLLLAGRRAVHTRERANDTLPRPPSLD